jgi:hypothetical protein
MTTLPGQLDASGIIATIEAGQYPREIILTIARGFLPLPQDDLITVLAYLTNSSDAEIAKLSHDSLADVPPQAMRTFASNDKAPPDHLALLVRASGDPIVLESLVRNRAVTDSIVIELARRADAHTQEVIVINHARILRAPEILDALEQNPHLTPDARRRAAEVREEFFAKKSRLQALAEELGPQEDELIADISMEAIADLLDQAVAEQGSDEPPPPDLTEAEADDATKRTIWERLQTMSVAEKVQLAFKGNKTIRMILVRERNKLVCGSVMRNPRMTENEVEQIASMKNVEEEVLRLLGMRRDWTSKYNIAVQLVRNPKAPVGVVLPLINRLTLRDLKGLKDDKGVSEAVRVNAKKMYQAKQKS